MHTNTQHQIAGRQWLSDEASKPAEIPGRQEKLLLFGIPLALTARSITIAFLLFGCIWIVAAGLFERQFSLSVLPHMASGIGLILMSSGLLYLLILRFTKNNSSSHQLIIRAFHGSPNGIAVVRDQDRQILGFGRQRVVAGGEHQEGQRDQVEVAGPDEGEAAEQEQAQRDAASDEAVLPPDVGRRDGALEALADRCRDAFTERG